jgi:hypothetical protein
MGRRPGQLLHPDEGLQGHGRRRLSRRRSRSTIGQADARQPGRRRGRNPDQIACVNSSSRDCVGRVERPGGSVASGRSETAPTHRGGVVGGVDWHRRPWRGRFSYQTPLLVPGIVATALLGYITAWNEPPYAVKAGAVADTRPGVGAAATTRPRATGRRHRR